MAVKKTTTDTFAALGLAFGKHADTGVSLRQRLVALMRQAYSSKEAANNTDGVQLGEFVAEYMLARGVPKADVPAAVTAKSKGAYGKLFQAAMGNWYNASRECFPTPKDEADEDEDEADKDAPKDDKDAPKNGKNGKNGPVTLKMTAPQFIEEVSDGDEDLRIALTWAFQNPDAFVDLFKSMQQAPKGKRKAIM